MTVSLRHAGRRAARIREDVAWLRAELPPGVPAVVHAGAPEREGGETLQQWRERVAAHYLALRLAALRDYHGAGG